MRQPRLPLPLPPEPEHSGALGRDAALAAALAGLVGARLAQPSDVERHAAGALREALEVSALAIAEALTVTADPLLGLLTAIPLGR